MVKDESFHEYVVSDLLRNVSGITSRAMFGGWGIYKDGVIFAIIADGELYFKVGDENKADYERLGSHPFVYTAHNNKPMTMSYWILPDEVMDDEDMLVEWVERAVDESKKNKK